MKRLDLVFFFVVLVCITTLVFAKPEKSDGRDVRTIGNSEGHVREGPRFLAKFLFTAAYGDLVEVLETSNVWHRVRVLETGEGGWLHRSALIRKRILLEPGRSSLHKRARKGDLSLAGRGFSLEVERDQRRRRVDLEVGYARLEEHVDRQPELVPTIEEIARFRAEGGLQLLAEGSS